MKFRRHGSRSESREAPDRGFSLVETLVAFGLTVAVSSMALVLFSFHQRLARAQLDAASLQQAQRAAHVELRRTLRGAGRGGLAHQLPGQPSRSELALTVEENVPEGHLVGTREVLAGTDVVVVRGVIHGPLYWVEDYGFDPGAGRGWIEVRALTAGGLEQSLTALRAAGAVDEDALLLVSGQASVHAVVPIAEVTTTGWGSGRTVRVAFHNDPERGPVAASYLGLSSGGAWPTGLMGRVVRAGVLEEWRFYVRPPASGTAQRPQLAMARLYPGTQLAWNRRSANLYQAVADDIVDLRAWVSESPQGRHRSVNVVTTAGRQGAAAALRVERTAASVVRLRNLR